MQVRGECTVASQGSLSHSGSIRDLGLDPQSMGGFVEIAVQPASAKIFLDGRPIGTGPSIGLEVDCGNHVFEFRALHYAAEEHPISIGMGNVIQLSVDLQQAGTGNIAVIVDPESADIFLDGRKVATGNTTLNDIGQGSHLLGAMLTGYEPIERRIQVKAGETSEVELSLKAEVDDIYTANQPETPSPTESAPESTTASELSNTDNTDDSDSNGTSAPKREQPFQKTPHRMEPSPLRRLCMTQLLPAQDATLLAVRFSACLFYRASWPGGPGTM